MPLLKTPALLVGTLLGLGALVAAPPASAQGPVQMQRVYVIATAVEPELEAVAARVGAAARSALRGLDSADWQGPDQRYLGYDDNTLERLRVARAKLDEGRAAYLDLRLDEATTLLNEAVENFDLALSALEDPTDLGTALLFLGAAQTYNNDRRGAARTFNRLHVQMPHIAPDPELFPPDVIERYQQAAVRQQDATIQVESDPPGSTAFVNFLPRGTTPVTVGSLPRGEHSVRVAAPGATPYIENVDASRRPGSVNAILMTLDENEGLAEAVGAIAGHELRDGDGPIAEVGRILELDKIGVVRVSYGDNAESIRLELVIFDVASQRRILRGEVLAPRALGDLENVVTRAVTQSMQNALAPQTATDAERPFQAIDLGTSDTAPSTPSERQPVYKQWWLWTIVGAAVVAGVVTAVVLSRSGTPLGQDQNGYVVFQF